MFFCFLAVARDDHHPLLAANPSVDPVSAYPLAFANSKQSLYRTASSSIRLRLADLGRLYNCIVLSSDSCIYCHPFIMHPRCRFRFLARSVMPLPLDHSLTDSCSFTGQNAPLQAGQQRAGIRPDPSGRRRFGWRRLPAGQRRWRRLSARQRRWRRLSARK